MHASDRHIPVTSGRSLSIGEAARLLGVSIRTVRRWEASGHLTALRTEGGHRRFAVDAVLRLRQAQREGQPDAPEPRLRSPNLPSRSLPALAQLLAARTDAIVARTVSHMYAGEFGWFRSAAAAPHVRSFLDGLAAAAKSGDWRLVEPATATLMVRAARADRGPSYHEAFHFLRTLRAVLMQPLHAQDPSVRIALLQLFETVERRAAQEAGLFFEPAARVGETPRPGGHPTQTIAERARRSARRACEALAAMPACGAALVLAGGSEGRELEIVGAAGVQVAADARFALGGDPFSLALTAGTPALVRSTSAVRRLPTVAAPAWMLPIVASAQSGELRVATVLLIRAGRDVDSRVLAPLGDLNGRLTAVLDGSAHDEETGAEASRVGEYLR